MYLDQISLFLLIALVIRHHILHCEESTLFRWYTVFECKEHRFHVSSVYSITLNNWWYLIIVHFSWCI